jgi:hypothetical protein
MPAPFAPVVRVATLRGCAQNVSSIRQPAARALLASLARGARRNPSRKVPRQCLPHTATSAMPHLSGGSNVSSSQMVAAHAEPMMAAANPSIAIANVPRELTSAAFVARLDVRVIRAGLVLAAKQAFTPGATRVCSVQLQWSGC